MAPSAQGRARRPHTHELDCVCAGVLVSELVPEGVRVPVAVELPVDVSVEVDDWVLEPVLAPDAV